jgi:hypothetical protein
MHPSARQHVTVALPSETWDPSSFFLRSMATATEYHISRQPTVDLDDYTAQPSPILRRGALHEAFTQLFTTPFDASSLSPADLQLRPELPAPAASPAARPMLAIELGASNAVAHEVSALAAARVEFESLLFDHDAVSLAAATGTGGGVRETQVNLAGGVAWRHPLRRLELGASALLGPGLALQTVGPSGLHAENPRTSSLWSPTLSASPALRGGVWLGRRLALAAEARATATVLRLEDSLGFTLGLAAYVGFLYAL